MDLFKTKSILKERRALWIDYDKGISILLVGYGHSFAVLNGHGVNFDSYHFFNYIGYFLYGFRMPLFFIISGILIANSLKKKGLKGYIYARANNILHPLIIWGIIEVSIKLLTKDNTSSSDSGINSYLNLLIDPRKTGVFWYLNALFFIGVIYASIKVHFKVNTLIHIAIGFIFYSISAYITVNDLSAGFITDILKYYIFFAIGDFISKIMFSNIAIKWLTSIKLILPLLIVFIIMQYYITEINLNERIKSIIYIEHKHPYLFLIQALIGCGLSLCVSFVLQKYKLLTFLRIVGYHSLFIYCMQIIIMNFIRIIAVNFVHISYPPLLLLITWSLGTIIPIFIYNISIKFNFWWLYTFNKVQKSNA